MTKPYSYIVRFDIAPLWMADGFTLTDEVAQDMLSTSLGYADSENELAARVLVAPDASRIEAEQGYRAGGVVDEIKRGCPHAYSDDGISDAILSAIKLLDSVAFVREEGDETAEVLAKLATALGVINGDESISDIDWQEAE